MELLVHGLGVALLILGFLGCVLPMLPGPLLGYGALWVLYLFGPAPSVAQLAIGGAMVGIAMVVDYILPSFFAKKFKCSKRGLFGCALGTFAGLFFLPWGIVLGPVVGTVLGELSVGKSLWEAARGGFGAFCGFVSCCVMKLAVVGWFAWWFVQLVTGR